MKGGKLARLSASFCSQAEFLQFTGTITAEDAAVWIRETCCVESRAELDNDPAAAQRFHDRVRRRYVRFQGKTA